MKTAYDIVINQHEHGQAQAQAPRQNIRLHAFLEESDCQIDTG